MGFFSGIGKSLGSIVGGVGGFLLGGPSGAAIGAGLGGAIDSANATSAANAQNIALAREQMQFQKNMRQTAYQDAVKDLKKAGLNPMLAYSQGGAAVPAGATATVNPEFSPELVSSAFNAAAQLAQIEQAQAMTRQINAETAIKLQEANHASEFFLSRAQEQTGKAHKTAGEAEKLRRQRDAGLWDTVPVNKAQAEIANALASAENTRSMNQAMKMFMESDNPVIRSIGAILQLVFKK